MITVMWWMLLLLVTSLAGYSLWIAITWPMLILKNRCIFRQISRGMDTNTFCHDVFQRDLP